MYAIARFCTSVDFPVLFTSDYQNPADIIRTADRRKILPVFINVHSDVGGTDGNFRPVKINDLTFRTIQAFKPVGTGIIGTAEHGINFLSDKGFDIFRAFFPVEIGVVFLFASGLILHKADLDVWQMLYTVMDSSDTAIPLRWIPVLHTS